MSRPSRSIVRWATAPSIASVAMAVLLMPGLAEAQQRGDTQATQETLPFASGPQSVWGRGASTPEAVTFPLFDASIGADYDDGSFTSWEGLKFGGSIDMSAQARIGMNFVVETMPGGSLSVTYPVGAHVVFPAPNSFAPGDPVKITTSWAAGAGATLSSESPETRLSIRGPWRSTSSIGGEICVLQCESLAEQSLTVPDQEVSFFSVGDAGIGVGDQFLDVQRWEFTLVEKFLLGISGVIENPRGYPSGTGSGSSISAHSTQRWLDVNWDLDTFLARIGLLAAPGGIGVNFGGVNVGYNLWDLDQDLRFDHARNFDFEATPQVTVAFPVAMAWFVEDAGGTQLDVGMGTDVTFDVGNSLTVIFPTGRVDPIAMQPTYGLANMIESYGAWTYAGNMRDTLLTADFQIPSTRGSVVKNVRIGTHWSFSCNADTWGQVTCDIARALADGAKAASRFWNKVVDYADRTFFNTFDGVNEHVGPVQADVFAQFSATEVYHKASWELDGFGTMSGTAFSLDPEDPSIAVTTSLANTLMAGGSEAGTVMQTIVVTNTGDIRLDAASVLDALNANGITVEMIQSFDMTANGSFDGHGVSETLAMGQTIGIGESAEITIRVAGVPGLHNAAVRAAGTSPISGRVVTADADASFGWYSLDIKPEKLNRKSKGKLPVDLYGSPTLDVRLVDWATVRLEGVAPVKIEFEDEDGDDGDEEDEEDEGFYGPHLEFKFDRQDILAGMDARLGTTTTVAAPAPIAALQFAITGQRVADALLGIAGPGVDVMAMDRAGNGNGMLDVGDLRAALMANGVVLAAGKKDKKDKEKKDENHEEHEDDEDDDAPGTPTILVLTGSLTDGTPFWAEGSVLIKEEN